MSNDSFDIGAGTLRDMHPIFKMIFSFGSNQGDLPTVLTRAVEALVEIPDLIVVDISPVYQTPFQEDGLEQDDYLNLVMLTESTLEPMTLLDRVFAIEENFGRGRTVPNEPRTLGINIIMAGKRTSKKDIEPPHPWAREGVFVLVPWLDIDPTGEIAGVGPVAELAKHVDGTGVVKRDDIIIASPGRR